MRVIIKKKKVVSHGAHHSGAWKVAYADFVTAMMAFFLVMWILGLSEETRKAISGYFADPGLFSFSTGKAVPINVLEQTKYRATVADEVASRDAQLAAQREKMKTAAERIAETLKLLGEKDESMRRMLESVEIEVTPDGLRIELIEGEDRGFFEVGGARPNEAARKILASLAPQLSKIGHPLRIEGHTDARPFPPARAYGNWELSADRANAARRLLEHAGVPPSQIQAVAGFADRHLKKPDRPLHITNRRVTILVWAPEGATEG